MPTVTESSSAVNPERGGFDPEKYKEFGPNPGVETSILREQLKATMAILRAYGHAKMDNNRNEMVNCGNRFIREMVGILGGRKFNQEQVRLIARFNEHYSKILPEGEFNRIWCGLVAEIAVQHALMEFYLTLYLPNEWNDQREATDLFVDLSTLPSPHQDDGEDLRPGVRYLRLQIKALPLKPHSKLPIFVPVWKDWLKELVNNPTFSRQAGDIDQVPKEVLTLADKVFSLDEWQKPKNYDEREFVDELLWRKRNFINRLVVLLDRINREDQVQAGIVIVPSLASEGAVDLYNHITGKPCKLPGEELSEIAKRLKKALYDAFVVHRKESRNLTIVRSSVVRKPR